MDKKKLGKYIYYASLIVLIVVLAIALIIFDTEDKVYNSFYRYMVCFYGFAGILPIGVIIREFLLGDYIKKKMIIKIILVGTVLIIGTILFVLLNLNAQVALLCFLASLLILTVVIVPTNAKQK